MFLKHVLFESNVAMYCILGALPGFAHTTIKIAAACANDCACALRESATSTSTYNVTPFSLARSPEHSDPPPLLPDLSLFKFTFIFGA